jgi:hypothetical protein
MAGRQSVPTWRIIGAALRGEADFRGDDAAAEITKKVDSMLACFTGGLAFVILLPRHKGTIGAGGQLVRGGPDELLDSFAAAGATHGGGGISKQLS